MADFPPKLEAWTRFAEGALNGLLASVESKIPAQAAARLSAEYADEMTKVWEERKAQFAKEHLAKQGL